MKILFVAVFSSTSTNNSQAEGFEVLGHEVIRFNYRVRAAQLGSNELRDAEIVQICENERPDLVVFSKCDCVSTETIKRCTTITKTCLWFMDPVRNFRSKMPAHSKAVTYVCCDKTLALEKAKSINSNSFLVHEGFDSSKDIPHPELEQIYDVTFIGNLYGQRKQYQQDIGFKVITAYGEEHAKSVSRSKISLNFCTTRCASDRIYKVLAAGGFLLTDDWDGREKVGLEDGVHLIIFDGLDDLCHKIKFYLNRDSIRDSIAAMGHTRIQKFTRIAWAKSIIDIRNDL